MAEYPDIPLRATQAQIQGGTYIVTGANTGIGYETAKHLLNLGAGRVIMAVRNIEAGEKARAKIASELGNNKDGGKNSLPHAEVWRLDLASFASVKTFAKKAIAGLDRIDGLIENAGVFAASREEKPEGWNASTTVNVLSTFLLAGLLLPKMSEAAREARGGNRAAGDTDKLPPTIVIVGSTWGFQFRDSWEKVEQDPLVLLDDEKACEMGHVYALSKLIDIQCTRQLGSTIAPFSKTGVIINVVCPGLCGSDLARYQTQAFQTHIFGVIKQVGRTPEQGSRNLLYAVIAGEGSCGRFLEHAQDADNDVPDWVVASQKHTWNVVARELEKIEPGMLDDIAKI